MTTEGIMQIAVIGAGLMGHGIAQEFASAGYHVLMHDVTDEQLQTARTQIEKNLSVLAENAIRPYNDLLVSCSWFMIKSEEIS